MVPKKQSIDHSKPVMAWVQSTIYYNGGAPPRPKRTMKFRTRLPKRWCDCKLCMMMRGGNGIRGRGSTLRVCDCVKNGMESESNTGKPSFSCEIKLCANWLQTYNMCIRMMLMMYRNQASKVRFSKKKTLVQKVQDIVQTSSSCSL
mmetsp:Transcript_13823/g.19649  ORF Transcript_13823/g.19649 Transcript_13823/m.19649 type:complete len:146 (-) Transcript_13823:251-688(-)